MECGIRGVSKIILLAPLFFHLQISSGEVIGLAARNLIRNDGKVLKAFFCPKNNELIRDIVVDLIGQSNEVFAALYQFTHLPVIDALKAIHKARNVPVHVVVDSSGNISKTLTLPSAGVELYVEGSSRLMHHKVMVFKNVLDGRNVVMTGSMNVTDSGVKRNFENVIFCDDPETVAVYQAEVEELIRNSYRISEVENPQELKYRIKNG